MKKLIVPAALAAVLSGCSTVVPPGWEGIRVNNVGARRGTEQYPIQTGRVFYNPFTEDVYTYPISKKNYVWTASPREGSPQDESIGFNSIEGTNVNADVGVVFNVKPGQTPALFVTYRQELHALADGVIRNEVRDALNREAGRMKIMDIIGPGKGALLDSVKADLNTGPLGAYIYFETVSFVHNPRPDANVQEAINLVIAAKNTAEAAVAKANGVVNAARGDSAASVIAAKGQAEANRLLRESLTNEVLDWEKLQKWNGVLPQVTGAAALVNLK